MEPLLDLEAGGEMPDSPPRLILIQSAPMSSNVALKDTPDRPPLLIKSVSDPGNGHQPGDHLSHSFKPHRNEYFKVALNRFRSDSLRLIPIGRRSSFAPAPVFFCGICLENENLEKSFYFASCREAHRYCKECMSSYARIQIKDGVTDLMCPHPDDCGGHATDEEVGALVEPELLHKYFTFREASKNPNMRVCSACNRHCYGSKETPSITCECGVTFCFLHDLAHPNMSCSQYATLTRKAEQQSEKLVTRISKKCPNCRADTIKNGGCNHMTCVKCKENWCWICGRVMGDNHFAAGNIFGCPGGQFRNVPESRTIFDCFCIRNIVSFIINVWTVLLGGLIYLFLGLLFLLVLLTSGSLFLPLGLLILIPAKVFKYRYFEEVFGILAYGSLIVGLIPAGCLSVPLLLVYICCAISFLPITLLLFREDFFSEDGCDFNDENFIFRYFFYPLVIALGLAGMFGTGDD